MCSLVTIRIFRHLMTAALLAVLLGAPAALAQNAVEDCMEQGYRPGTAGFFQCLQSAEAARRQSEVESPATGEAGSILNGSPDNAVTDYSGSSMEGATTPDPDILKQLNSGTKPNR